VHCNPDGMPRQCLCLYAEIIVSDDQVFCEINFSLEYNPPMPPNTAEIRPPSTGQILGQAITIYRRNFWTFIGIITLVQVPVALLQFLLSLSFYDKTTVSQSADAALHRLVVDGLGPPSASSDSWSTRASGSAGYRYAGTHWR